jgi:hypothetical protein
VTRIDPGVVWLVAELRGHERQAAEELGQRKTRVEERKILDASPAARALELEKRGAGVRGVIDAQVPVPAAGQSAAVPPQGGLPGGRRGPPRIRYTCSSSRQGICWSRGRRQIRAGTSVQALNAAQIANRMTVTSLNRTSGYLGP